MPDVKERLHRVEEEQDFLTLCFDGAEAPEYDTTEELIEWILITNKRYDTINGEGFHQCYKERWRSLFDLYCLFCFYYKGEDATYPLFIDTLMEMVRKYKQINFLYCTDIHRIVVMYDRMGCFVGGYALNTRDELCDVNEFSPRDLENEYNLTFSIKGYT